MQKIPYSSCVRTRHENEEVEQVLQPSDSNNSMLRLIAETLFDDEKVTSYSNNYGVWLAVNVSYPNRLPVTSKRDEAINTEYSLINYNASNVEIISMAAKMPTSSAHKTNDQQLMIKLTRLMVKHVVW